MWLWILIGLAVVGVLGVLFYFVRRMMRVVNLLNVDGLDLMKRVKDGSIEDHILAKYKEKKRLFQYRLKKFLRERVAAETDEKEKSFMQKALELLDENGVMFFVMMLIKVRGTFETILWKLGLKKVVIEYSLEISIRHKYIVGYFEERYRIYNLSDSVLAEAEDLETCGKELF